ncbi:unnamed protein product [Rhizoctonia solani]|uniref:proline dehydrogenase n=1 Tax=Rhizoctonia solani TaxID=456999 RepID=A0A8H2XRD8_9AGAM|nr:unnamed protein product [Rhizoctonia solani]
MATAKPGEQVESDPAVWSYKHETDRCFDEAAESLIQHGAASLASKNPRQPKLGLLFGTHNKQSCQHVLDCMVSSGLAHKNKDGLAEVKPGVEDMVCFGQLYGMRDELTNWIASVFKSDSPMAFKYLPYGALAEVMPYLSRRAIENQSVLSGGGAASERKRAGELILPTLVNWSPTILEACASIPGVREISQAVVRRTFFAQFVGGDTCDDTLPLIVSLRKQNKGTLLAYSVEVDEVGGGRADQWKKNVEEMVASVEFAADFEDTQNGSRKTWVAIKLAIPSADSLKRMSKFLIESRPKDEVPFPGTPGSFDMVVFRGEKGPLIEGGLTEEDIESLRTLYKDLRTVCSRAKERGIRLIFDAEHTWYQPGIDAFVLALSREFNKSSSRDRLNEQPLVYATYQAYLKRTPGHLSRSIQDAQNFGYVLGVKLVRGAYYDKETAEHSNLENPNYPVWTEKLQTDACYNNCARLLINELAKYHNNSSPRGISGSNRFGNASQTSSQTGIGILFGTHNALSCAHILESLVDAGLASRTADDRIIINEGVEEHLCFGQLYGMRDDLTDWMVRTVEAKSPMVLKYVPYGALADVMPYLARRAIENRSVLGGEGGATTERRMCHRKPPRGPLFMSSKNPSDPNKKLIRADPTTIRGKFLVGYQGWFTCPGDGPVLVQGNEWAHWTDNDGQFNAELLPDPEYYSPGDLVVMPRAQHKLYSSRNPAIIRRHMNIMAMHGIDGLRHMNIMAMHGIDGLFVTRRGSEIAAAYQPGGNGIGIMKLRSEGINTLFRAAEAEGRVVSIMYDLNGLPSHQIEPWVAGDWDFMLHSKHAIESPAYVREHGQPVVALWSVGFKHAGQDPEMIMRLINRIREMAGGAYIILGVPITWQKQDQNWQAVYSVADAIAPMCIGTLLDEEGINNYSKTVQHPGVEALKSAQHKTDYVGVVWPGNEGELTINTGMSTGPAPRQDGAFLWRQIYNAHKDGVRFMYAEMFDGFEEGTAILPSLGAQNDNTPSDWYLRICSYASEALKGEKRLYEEFPRKEIFEYWSTRPHYEEHQEQGAAGGSSSGNQTGAPALSPLPAPARTQTRGMTVDIADAPPPYSLEADASPAPASGSFTAEPESIPSGPVNPVPAPASYQGPLPSTDRPPASRVDSTHSVLASACIWIIHRRARVNSFGTDRPPASRVDSTHSVGSHGSYPGQHRPDPIAVPGAAPLGVAVQTPTPYTGHGLGQAPTGFPSGPAPPMPGLGGASSPPPMHTRPPQHPSTASRPTTAPRPPSRPGRPSSSSGGHPSPPPGTFPSPGGSGMHHITAQMGAMGVGPNRPAPEHVFAGAGQPRPPMHQMTGVPSSPFEGVNFPGRFGAQESKYGTQDPGSGLFGPTSSIPPTPSSGGIPGSPFYPAPLQGGGPHSPGPMHQHSPGPAHQHSPGPVHQNTLAGSPHPMSPPPGPHHQSTIGPGQQHHAPSPHHQNSIGPGPHHQNTLGLGPHHQNTLGPGQSQPPPQPSFQAHQPYVPPGQHTPGLGPGQYPQGPAGQYTPNQGSSGHHSGGSTPQSWAGSNHPSYPNSPYGHPQTPGGHSQAPAPGGHSQAGYNPAAGGSGYPPQAPGHSGQQPHGPVAQQQQPGQAGYIQQMGQAQHPQWETVPGGQYIGSALGTIGKFTGEENKKKIEQGIGSAFNAGTKLWGKFSK